MIKVKRFSLFLPKVSRFWVLNRGRVKKMCGMRTKKLSGRISNFYLPDDLHGLHDLH